MRPYDIKKWILKTTINMVDKMLPKNVVHLKNVAWSCVDNTL